MKKTKSDPASWGDATKLVRGGLDRSPHGETAEAIDYYKQALDARTALADGDPGNEEYLYEQASAEADLALMRAKAGDTAEATAGLQRADAILSKLSAEMQETDKFKATKATLTDQLAALQTGPPK